MLLVRAYDVASAAQRDAASSQRESESSDWCSKELKQEWESSSSRGELEALRDFLCYGESKKISLRGILVKLERETDARLAKGPGCPRRQCHQDTGEAESLRAVAACYFRFELVISGQPRTIKRFHCND